MTIDLRPWGFAPGFYSCKCSEPHCQTADGAFQGTLGHFMGAKRSWRCETCARMKRDLVLDAEDEPKSEKRRIPQLVRDLMRPRQGLHEANVNATPAVTKALLVGKLHAEIEEVALDVTNAEEYGDVLEALMALATVSGVSWADVEAARIAKRARKGGLETGNLWIPEAFMDEEFPNAKADRAA